MEDPGFSTAREGARGDADPSSLEDVVDVATIGDHVSEELANELPGGWTVQRTLVQFGAEPLEEALEFERSPADPRLLLKPAAFAAPTADVEWHVRRGPATGREHVRTVDTLAEALRAAVNWTHQQTRP